MNSDNGRKKILLGNTKKLITTNMARMVLTIQQRRFLEKARTLDNSTVSTFEHGFPVLLEATLLRGEYSKHDAQFLNRIGDVYKKWLNENKPQV